MKTRRSVAAIAGLIEQVQQVLREEHPQTLRQLFYQMVVRKLLGNTMSEYRALSHQLVKARKAGLIQWEAIEDRTRMPHIPAMWDSPREILENSLYCYRRNVWLNQARLIEVWIEKEALSAVFERATKQYGVTVNVGRGYDGWSSIYEAAQRFRKAEQESHPVTVLYFGDFDPTGEDISRSLAERFLEFGCEPGVVRCALSYEDIQLYNLPAAMTKTSDSRAAKHIAKYGEVSSVELDALPSQVLRERIRTEIEKRMDMDALILCRQQEHAEIAELFHVLQKYDA